MITLFIIAVTFTLSVSALCSTLEAMILSTRGVEVERLKITHPAAGKILEQLRHDIEGTIASILTVNTVANTLGSIMVGAVGTKAFGDWWIGVISAAMTLGILFLSEILPKNIGVLYRTSLHPVMVYPLFAICRIATPLTNMTTWMIRKLLKRPPESDSEGEIALLAEKAAQTGKMSQAQLRLIHSSLEIHETTVGTVMTPRNVVVTCEADETIGELFDRLENFRFARMPVIGENPDDILGVARRKDFLHALAEGNTDQRIREVMKPLVIVPEVGNLSKTLELLLSEHQQLAIVVDEFGGFAGVVTLEDIFEFLIGREFYEYDDVAVDMQELARRRSKKRVKQ